MLELVGFLLWRQNQVDAAGFAEAPQVPFVHLGDNLLYRRRHGLEAPLSAAVNVVGCELLFKLPLVADTNHGNAFSNDNRPGEQPCEL